MPEIKFYAVGAHEGKTVTLDRFEFVDGACTFVGSPQDCSTMAHVMASQYQAFPENEWAEAKRRFDEAQAEEALSEPATTPASIEMNIKQRIVARRFIDEKLDPDVVYGPGQAADILKANIAALLAEDADGNDVLNADELAQRKAAEEEAERLKREADEQAEKERLEKEAEEQAEKERLQKEADEQAEKDRLQKEADEQAEKDRLQKEADDKAAAEAALLSQGQGGDGSQDNGGGQQPPEDAKIETVADALQALDPANDEHWTARGVPSIEAMVKILGRPVTRAEVEETAPDYTRAVAKAAKASS